MKKPLLLIAAIFISCSLAYSQENKDLKRQIEKKEIELTNSAKNSRQVHNTLTTELKKLYEEYRLELEGELKTITDEQLLLKKKEELGRVNEKIQNYSQN